MEVVVFGILAALCAIGAYRLRRRHQVMPGVITLANGHRYTYLMGDNLPGEAVRFHGMEIQLTHALTDFYLDAQRDSKRMGPNMLFAPGQEVRLEGNFHKYFRLYVPAGTQVAALSILSPDVMQALLHRRTVKFDIQIHQDRLRIIAPYMVFDKDAYQIDLKWAAKVLLPQIDHRLSSWQPTDTTHALQYKKGLTFKIAGRYFRCSRLVLTAVGILLLVAAVGVGLIGYYTLQDPKFDDLYSKGPILGTLMYMGTGALLLLAFCLNMLLLVILGWFLTNQRKAGAYLLALIGR